MRRFRTIGIIGGMSAESTVVYYRRIVRRHQETFHDHSYPRIIISSVSFQQYADWQHRGAWDQIAKGLAKELRAVAAAGADFALLATNTMHKVLPAVRSPIPVLSILDAVSRYAKREGIRRLGLTGTRFTMSDGFYVQGLHQNGLTAILPSTAEQETIHTIIYQELISGRILPSSIRRFAAIARRLSRRGADAVLLACTELEMLTRSGGD